MERARQQVEEQFAGRSLSESDSDFLANEQLRIDQALGAVSRPESAGPSPLNMFTSLPVKDKLAVATALSSFVVPQLSTFARRARDAIAGIFGPEEQEKVIEDLKQFDETGQTDNIGIGELRAMNPQGMNTIMEVIRLVPRRGQITTFGQASEQGFDKAFPGGGRREAGQSFTRGHFGGPAGGIRTMLQERRTAQEEEDLRTLAPNMSEFNRDRVLKFSKDEPANFRGGAEDPPLKYGRVTDEFGRFPMGSIPGIPIRKNPRRLRSEPSSSSTEPSFAPPDDNNPPSGPPPAPTGRPDPRQPPPPPGVAPARNFAGFSDPRLTETDESILNSRFLDTDMTSTQSDIQSQSFVYAQAANESNLSERNRLINIINAANQMQVDQDLELIEDKNLAHLQEQRYAVNHRPVPNYNQNLQRFSGLERVRIL